MNGNLIWNEIQRYISSSSKKGSERSLSILNDLFNGIKFSSYINEFDVDLLKKFIITYSKSVYRTGKWNEDAITQSLIDDIMDNFEQKSNSRIALNTFKSTGACESKFGDIAFIIRFHVSKNKIVEGVGFIEAKRDYDNNIYKELKQQQIDEFLKNTMSSFYCFYSRKSFFPTIETSFLNNQLKAMHINKINTITDKHLNLFIKPKTLIDQYERFINGYDLDFNNSSIDIAKGFEESKGYPCYLLDIEVFQEGSTPEPTPNKINENVYETYIQPKYISFESTNEKKANESRFDEEQGFSRGM